jgi:transposase
MNYIGLDAHSTTCTFVVLNGFGKESKTQVVKTSEIGIREFIESLSGEKLLTFEESTLSRWLHAVIEPLVDKLVICNPIYLNRKQGPKNDYTDALHLAQQLRGDFLIPVYHSQNELMELRILVSAYNDIVKENTRLKNQYSALIRSEVIALPSEYKRRKFYHDEELYKKLSSVSGRFVGEKSFSRLQYLEEIKNGYLAEFKKLQERHVEIKALATIPGIGLVRAVYIVAQTGTAKRFKNKHHYWSYCGLASYDKMSGGKSYGKVRVQGSRSLKWVFLGAAETVLIEKNALKSIFDHEITKGNDRRLAKRALSRKIASIALSVMRTRKEYDPGKLGEIPSEVENEIEHESVETI